MARTGGRKKSGGASAVGALQLLEQRKYEFGPDAASAKLDALARVVGATLSTADEVMRLHEALSFLAAYPDNHAILTAARAALDGFAERRDLRRHRDELADTGIAGTSLYYRFFNAMAAWLAENWPDRLEVDWAEFEESDRLVPWLPILALYAESPAVDECDFDVRGWLARLKRPTETDGTFLARRMATLPLDEFAREVLWDQIDAPMRLAPGPGGPSRTGARFRVRPIVFQDGPLLSQRPKLPDAILEPPLAVTPVSLSDGRRLVALAKEAMVTRQRDLDAFANADPRDVRMIDCGNGLRFACIGVRPERRLVFEAIYGLLTLKNEVPIGYVLVSSLFQSCEIAYNVFETYRGGEAAWVYGRVLATCRLLFDADSFTIYPYQLGDDNKEAIASGAWWFYQKLGFRAKDKAVLKTMTKELARMGAKPGYRSPPETLKELATENVYYHLGAPREDIIGLLPLGEMGLAVVDYLSKHYGSDRERARTECAKEAARVLGVASFKGWTPGERLAWERLAPVALSLPDVAKWSAADRTSLAEMMRSKGGLRESDFVRKFDAHPRLRRALLSMSQEQGGHSRGQGFKREDAYIGRT